MKKIYSKLIKKVYLATLLVVLLLPLISHTQVFASSLDSELIVVTVSGDITITPFAEETKLYFATDELGRLWYRIWSLTYGEWKTDWILVG